MLETSAGGPAHGVPLILCHGTPSCDGAGRGSMTKKGLAVRVTCDADVAVLRLWT